MSTKICPFFGSEKGCSGQKCNMIHDNPNSVSECRDHKRRACTYRPCKYRHEYFEKRDGKWIAVGDIPAYLPSSKQRSGTSRSKKTKPRVNKSVSIKIKPVTTKKKFTSYAQIYSSNLSRPKKQTENPPPVVQQKDIVEKKHPPLEPEPTLEVDNKVDKQKSVDEIVIVKEKINLTPEPVPEPLPKPVEPKKTKTRAPPPGLTRATPPPNRKPNNNPVQKNDPPPSQPQQKVSLRPSTNQMTIPNNVQPSQQQNHQQMNVQNHQKQRNIQNHQKQRNIQNHQKQRNIQNHQTNVQPPQQQPQPSQMITMNVQNQVMQQPQPSHPSHHINNQQAHIQSQIHNQIDPNQMRPPPIHFQNQVPHFPNHMPPETQNMMPPNFQHPVVHPHHMIMNQHPPQVFWAPNHHGRPQMVQYVYPIPGQFPPQMQGQAVQMPGHY